MMIFLRGVIVTEVPFFDLRRATISRRDSLHRIFDATLESGYFVGGAAVLEFEREFARYIGVQECVGVGNGLDALRIGMEALGIGPGDEVIVPGFTFFATWLAVLQAGGIPVPVDVGEDTAALTASSVAPAITKRTKALIVVHLYGIPADFTGLRSLADDAGIYLIEDAAQCHGASSEGRLAGSIGDFAAFSFYPTKNLGALGDGGAITTNSGSLASKARSKRSYGQGANKYDHIDTGWNSRLDSLQASFLANDLPNLDFLNSRRRVIASIYLDALGGGSQAVVGTTNHAESVWHHFVLRTVNRDDARRFFTSRGIGTDIHYPYYFGNVAPLNAYSESVHLPNSKLMSEQVLSLPISPWLTDLEIEKVASALTSLPRELLVSC